jgi:hypothetical protein
MNRDEHLAWCKQRALEYVKEGDLTDAVASMISDLGKHPGTAMPGSPVFMLGLMEANAGDADRVRHWIEGFN